MKKSVLAMFHLLFWIFTCLFAIVVFEILSTPARLFGGSSPGIIEYLTSILNVLLIGGCIFYVSYFSLSYFIKRPRRFVLIGLLYAIFFIVLTIEWYNSGSTSYMIDALMFFLPVFYFNLFGFLFKTFIEWIQDRKIKAELEKEKITTQLELLKSQINPHFLFTTLNNIDVLIAKDSEKASIYLKKLSDILRFMLYETKDELIPMSVELEYIEKYIDLQKIRTANDSFVNFKINGNMENIKIAPMIFIPFIENAFKHTSNKRTINAINIQFDFLGDLINFNCENFKNKNEPLIQKQNGLGVNLIEQRLNLLYKNKHTLKVENSAEKYFVSLKIQLNES